MNLALRVPARRCCFEFERLGLSPEGAYKYQKVNNTYITMYRWRLSGHEPRLERVRARPPLLLRVERLRVGP